jgi:MFS transporter, FSR family, fosmidomycin resistance protein
MNTLAADVPLRSDATTIGLVSVAHGMSHFCQLIVPPLFPWIGVAFGLSNTQLGLLLSVFFVTSCAGQTVAGFAVDRWGADRVLFGGLGLLALAALGLSVSPTYGVMLAFMAVAGLGNCVFHPVDYSILNERVSAPRLGHAYAAHGISGNAGWALAPVFVVGVTTATGSWRLALAAVTVVLALVVAVLWVHRDTLRVEVADKAAARAAGADGFAFLRLPAVWACFLFFMVFAVALGGVQSFAPAAAARLHDVPAAQVAICLSIYMVAAGAGMVLGGHLVRDAQRSVRIAAAGFGVAALVALALGLGHWSAVVVLMLFGLMGFGAGIAGPSRDLLVKQATPAGATGRVYGVVYSGLDVGMTLAPVMFGAMMDRGHFRSVWLGIALMLTLLIGTALNVRRNAQPMPIPAH